MKAYDALVYIGRFRPYHPGHHHVATEALKLTDNLIFVIGSHNQPRSCRNPYTTTEVIEMIMAAFPREELPRLKFVRQLDHTYNEEKWITSVQSAVNVLMPWQVQDTKIGLVGFDKDHSSYYLKLFPFWGSVYIEPACRLNATDYRNHFFAHHGEAACKDFYINESHRKVVMWANRNALTAGLDQEFEFIHKYKLQWQSSPYPPFFVTVDACVTQSGHLLVVKRRGRPGRGQIALPGGFVQAQETLREATIRELLEETKLAVPKPVLVGSIHQTKVFDSPHRSTRGRTITQTTHFKLADGKLPKVRGQDDAEKAFWMPLSQFVTSRELFFEDHFCMAESLLGL